MTWLEEWIKRKERGYRKKEKSFPFETIGKKVVYLSRKCSVGWNRMSQQDIFTEESVLLI